MNGEILTIESHLPAIKKADMKTVFLEMSGTEYISSIEGYVNVHHIEYLKVQTSRENILEVGTKKNLTKCKLFSFDIKTDEIPVSFVGHFDISKDDISTNQKNNKKEMFQNCPILINYGIELRKKDVYSNYSSKIK